MKNVEIMLEEWFVKKAPFQIPEDGRKGLVTAMPWVALVVGILSLFGAWGLWSAAMLVTSFAASVYVAPVVGPALVAMWINLLLLIAEGVLLLMAFSGLKAQKKSGWNLLFWAALLNVAYAVVNVMASFNLFGFIIALAESALGLYLLFQIRGYYVGAPAKAPTATAPVVKINTKK